MSTTTQQTESSSQPNSQQQQQQDSPVSTLLPTKSNVKVLSQAENGDLYLKVFLLDNSVNGNKWGIDPGTVEDNIQSAVDKPLVIYKDTGTEPDRWYWPRKKGMYNHPPWDEKDIEHSYEMQRPFTVGTIQQVAKNQQTGAWWGMVKITDDGVKKIFKENPHTPFYVSPQLRRLHFAQANQALRDWVFMHLAIVSVPAFGIQATTQGSCSGDSESCTRHFMNASLSHLPRDENGNIKSCGFCTYNAMKEIATQTIETENTGRTIHDVINQDTSHLTNYPNLKTEERLSDNSNTQNVSAGTPNAATISENVVSNGRRADIDSQQQPQQRTISVEHKTYPQPETTTYRPNAEPQVQTNAPGADKLALITRIEQEKAKRQEALQQLNILARDNQKLAKDAKKYETELAEVKNYMEAQKETVRENGIAEIVYSANLSNLVPEEKKEELIKLSLSKGLEPKDVAQFMTPLYEAFDSFIASQREHSGNLEQITQFNTPHVTANASLQNRRTGSRLTLGQAPRTEGVVATGNNTFNASLNKRSFSTELPFQKARKLAGMWTPEETPTGEVGY